MKKSLSFWQSIGFIVTCIAGTLLHFAYDWSNQSVFVAPFSAINESTWEHMKILFFPMFIFALVQSRCFGKQYQEFGCVKLFGITIGLALIPVLFYTYTGIFGISIDFVNISIFFISAAVSYILETRLLNQGFEFCQSTKIAFIILCLIALAFVIFTFSPPKIPLFENPGS